MLQLKLSFLNCFILILPILIWNAIFASKLPEIMQNEVPGISQTILGIENIFRGIIFILPVFMAIDLNDSNFKTGIILYSISTLIYFISWIPLVYFSDTNFSRHFLIWLAPAYTPLVVFISFSILGKSLLYGIIGTLFIIFHLAHETIRYIKVVK